MSNREQEIKELFAYASNSEPLHEHGLTICKNLAKLIADGKYSQALADQSWENLATAAAKSYSEQYGTGGRNLFTVEDRAQVAKRLAPHFEDDIQELLSQIAITEYVLVKIYDYSRDTNGNPTARHIALASNAEGLVAANESTVNPHRRQTGTGDYLNGVEEALSKGKFKEAAYDRVWIKGSRAEGTTLVLLKHKPMSIAQ